MVCIMLCSFYTSLLDRKAAGGGGSINATSRAQMEDLKCVLHFNRKLGSIWMVVPAAIKNGLKHWQLKKQKRTRRMMMLKWVKSVNKVLPCESMILAPGMWIQN